MSPFANPFRQLGQVPTAQPRPANPFMNMGIMSMMGGRPTISQDTPDPVQIISLFCCAINMSFAHVRIDNHHHKKRQIIWMQT